MKIEQNAAFSMIELLTVVAIIALLASFTIPAYLHQLMATKINALWQFAEPAKLYIEGQYLKSGATVSSITVNSGAKEITTADATQVKCVTIQGGVISVVGNPTNFNGGTYWVSWVPTVSNGAITWACKYGSTASQYILESAQNCTTGTQQYSADSACN